MGSRLWAATSRFNVDPKHISFSFRAGYAREIRNENYLVKNFTTSFFSFPFLFHSK